MISKATMKILFEKVKNQQYKSRDWKGVYMRPEMKFMWFEISFCLKKMWGKVLKSGISKFCGRQPLKNSLSPLLNTLSHMTILVFIAGVSRQLELLKGNKGEKLKIQNTPNTSKDKVLLLSFVTVFASYVYMYTCI